MNELSVDPLLAVVTDALHGLDPLHIGSESRDGLVVFVEDRQAGVKLRDKQQVLPGVDVGRQAVTGLRFEMLSVERQELQRVVSPVADDQLRISFVPVVDPDSVRSREPALAFAGAAEVALPVSVFVEPVYVVRAVAVDQKEVSIRQEGKVRRQEAVSPPQLFRIRVLAIGVDSGIHRSELLPDGLALERQLGEGLHLLISTDVKKLLAAFFANLDAVPAALELAAESTDEPAFGVENENRRMVFLICSAFVDDINIARLIDGNVVSRLPRILIRELSPVVRDCEFVPALADDQLCFRFAGSDNSGSNRCGDSGCSAGKKLAT